MGWFVVQTLFTMTKSCGVSPPNFTTQTIAFHHSRPMKTLQKSIFVLLAVCVLTLSSCFNIIEEVTFHNSGKGSYSMMFDMSGFKSTLQMFQKMVPPDTTSSTTASTPTAFNNPMSKDTSGLTLALKSVAGISNVLSINDSTNFRFGFAFDFEDVNSLNLALKTLHTSQSMGAMQDVSFQFNGKSFQRHGTGNFLEELTKSMARAGGSSADQEAPNASEMALFRLFFGDMSFKQVYHFPERKISPKGDPLGEISEDQHTLSIVHKLFDQKTKTSKQKSDAVVTFK